MEAHHTPVFEPPGMGAMPWLAGSDGGAFESLGMAGGTPTPRHRRLVRVESMSSLVVITLLFIS
jgi:hypothetical protein